jgi:hypothetical protein
MELLCPSCQQKLIIPDHFAGQMAKCPMCNNTFTAPELPPVPAAAFVPAPPSPTPLPDAPVVTPAPVINPTPELTPPPISDLAPAVTPVPAPTDGHGTASPPLPLPDSAAREVAPVGLSAPLPAVPPAQVPAPPPGDYRHRWSVHVNPHVLPWVAVAAVLGVFVLSFFPWVGRYPGGVPFVTQSAWQAAFGAESVDEEAKKLEKLPPAMRLTGSTADEVVPAASGLMIAYVLLLIPILLLTVAAAVWPLLPLPLPVALQRLRPWRWGLVTAVALLALVLLVAQEASGFSLENRVAAEADKLATKPPAAAAAPAEARQQALDRGLRLSQLHRTAALGWATGLNALAVVCALLVFWVERRGGRPLPRVDVLW